MDCIWTKNNLFFYIENQLKKAEKKRIEDHLSHCDICNEELLSYKNITARYASLQDFDVPNNFISIIFKNSIKKPARQTSLLQRLITEFIRSWQRKWASIPTFKPAYNIISIFAVLILIAFWGGLHVYKNDHKNQSELIQIFEKETFLEHTYQLPLNSCSIELNFDSGNEIKHVCSKIMDLKIKHESFTHFLNIDLEINSLKNKINQMKEKNIFRRNPS